MKKPIVLWLEFVIAADGRGYFIFDWTGWAHHMSDYHLITDLDETYAIKKNMSYDEAQLLLRAYLAGKDYGTILRVRLD